MYVIRGTNNVDTMLRMYSLVHRAAEIEVRGSKTKNVHNLAMVFDASHPIITSFKARGFNLAYAKREWLWYIGADRFDASIEDHATMWKKLRQSDGGFNSNYGQYLFARAQKTQFEDGENSRTTCTFVPDEFESSQFDYVVQTLANDPNSRRAATVLLRQEHLYPENTDIVCTYAIHFCIEAGRLNMTVMMRSNDVIFGFTNDAFCFWNLYAFVYSKLAEVLTNPFLMHGTYTHFSNSMHVYDRHYDMIAKLAAERTMAGYDHIDVPWPSAAEVDELIATHGEGGQGDYVEWLKA